MPKESQRSGDRVHAYLDLGKANDPAAPVLSTPACLRTTGLRPESVVSTQHPRRLGVWPLATEQTQQPLICSEWLGQKRPVSGAWCPPWADNSTTRVRFLGGNCAQAKKRRNVHGLCCGGPFFKIAHHGSKEKGHSSLKLKDAFS